MRMRKMCCCCCLPQQESSGEVVVSSQRSEDGDGGFRKEEEEKEALMENARERIGYRYVDATFDKMVLSLFSLYNFYLLISRTSLTLNDRHHRRFSTDNVLASAPEAVTLTSEAALTSSSPFLPELRPEGPRKARQQQHQGKRLVILYIVYIGILYYFFLRV